jgi:DNA-binding transcriptional regulator YiaG
MNKVKALHEKWKNDLEYRKAYDALEEEFALAAAIAAARGRAGLTQAEVAQRMQTTQSNIARLEAGRSSNAARAGRVSQSPLNPSVLGPPAKPTLAGAPRVNGFQLTCSGSSDW